MIRPICATWINSVSKKYANWKATSSWQTGTSTFPLPSKDRVFVFFQEVASLFFEILVKLLGGRWETEEAEGVQTCLKHADEVNCIYNNYFSGIRQVNVSSPEPKLT